MESETQAVGTDTARLAEWWEKPGRIEGLERTFKPDGLRRLALSSPDYYDSHGYYLPSVAVLAMHYHAELARVSREAEQEATRHHSLRWTLGLDTHPGEEPQSREDSHRNLDALLDQAALAAAGDVPVESEDDQP